MLRGSFDAAFLADIHGNLVECNSAARELLELTTGGTTHHDDNDDSDSDSDSTTTVRGKKNVSAFLLFHAFSHTLSWQEVVQQSATEETASPCYYEGTCLRKRSAAGIMSVHVRIVKLSCPCRQHAAGRRSSNGDPHNIVYLVVVRPSTPLQQQVAELQKEVSHLKHMQAALIQASEDSTILIDQDGIIQQVDEVTLSVFGYQQAKELVGRNISILMEGKHAQNHDLYIQNFLSTGVKRVMGKKRELEAKRKDGTTLPILLGVAQVEIPAEQQEETGEKRLFVGMLRDISKEKEHERELEHRQRLCEGIIEASFDAIFTINDAGIINMVNDAAVKQFGWSRDEFLGQSISMICGDGHGKKHDEYLKRYLLTGEKRVMGKKRELSARRKDGSEFPIRLGLTEVKDASGDFHMFCGFVEDISLQKEHELEMERKHRLTKGVVDAAFDSMFAIDKHGIILIVNDAATDQFGWKRDEFLGRNIAMVVGGEHASKHDGYIKRYLDTGEKRVMGTQRILPARRKDGSTFPIWLGLTEVYSNREGDARFIAFVRDLTDQKKMYEMEIMQAKQKALLRNMLPEEYFNYAGTRKQEGE